MSEGAREAGPTRPRPDDEISLVEVATLLLAQRRTILGVTTVFVLLSVVFALIKPTEYTSTGSFVPESSEGAPSGALALAAQFGVSLGGAGSERSPQFYADLITSNEILRQTVVSEYASTLSEDGTGVIDLVAYYELGEEDRGEAIEEAMEELEDDLSVSVGRETSIVSVSITTTDATLSRDIAAEILRLVNGFDLTSRQSQASAERAFSGERLDAATAELREAERVLRDFLMENRVFTNSPQLQFEFDRLQRDVAMRQEIVTSLAQAYEAARIDEVRNTPVLTRIETPRAPAMHDPKGRVLIVLLGGILGMMVAIPTALIRHATGTRQGNHDPEFEKLSGLWHETLGDMRRMGRRRTTS